MIATTYGTIFTELGQIQGEPERKEKREREREREREGERKCV